MAEPIYQRIEFCRSPKTLWGKIENGRYDWLGVHKNGQFVVGSPPVSMGFQAVARPDVIRAGVDHERFVVRAYSPHPLTRRPSRRFPRH